MPLLTICPIFGLDMQTKYLTEPRRNNWVWHQVIKEPHPPTRCLCHLCPYLHLQFPFSSEYTVCLFSNVLVILGLLMEKQQAMPRETIKRSKDQTAHSLQMRTQSTMRQCVGRGSWADSLPIILFPEQTEQTLARVVLRTSVELSPSVLSCSLPSWTCLCSAVTKRQTLGGCVGIWASCIYFLASKCTCTWLISM